jgi:hypothetical protein
MAILFVSGINDLSKIGLTTDDAGNVIQLLDGNCSIHQRVPLREGIDAYAVLFGKGVKQPRFEFIATPSLIVNQISDVDTHKGALERCIEMCSLTSAPVINHPRKILLTSRSRVSRLLQGIPGVTMPRTVRMTPRSPEDVFATAVAEHIDPPFLVRLAGDHGGRSMTRIDGPDERDRLHVYPFDGRDFYLTEFVDSRQGEDFYHRQRLVVIDGEPVLRGSLYDKHWKVHGASRRFMMERESWDEDRTRSAWLEQEVIPDLGPAVREITDRLELEIYGIDCSLRPGGRMVIFEANANMNFLTNDHPEMSERIDMIRRRILDMLARHSGENVYPYQPGGVH